MTRLPLVLHDLIYLPLNKKLFEIKFVEHEAIFYQLGALQMYDIKCELFEYNNEYIATGIDEIDALMANYSISEEVSAGIMAEDGLFILDEDGYNLLQESSDINTNYESAVNDELESEAAGYIDFSERDPFSEGVY